MLSLLLLFPLGLGRLVHVVASVGRIVEGVVPLVLSVLVLVAVLFPIALGLAADADTRKDLSGDIGPAQGRGSSGRAPNEQGCGYRHRPYLG